MTYDAEARRRRVQSRYQKRYEYLKLQGIPTSTLPAAPVHEHVAALHKLGWSSQAIADMTAGAITHTAITHLVRLQNPTVQRKTAAAILAIPLSCALPDTVPDTCMVPALGAVRRVRALMRLGWNHELMRQRYGFDTTSLSRGRTPHQMVARKWRAIAAAYEELCMTPGPSPKTATYARNYRFQPPLAWRDIDDPTERPRIGNQHGSAGEVVDREVVARLLDGQRIPSTKAEKEEAMRRWLAQGKSARSLALIHGWQEGRYVVRDEEEVA